MYYLFKCIKNPCKMIERYLYSPPRAEILQIANTLPAWSFEFSFRNVNKGKDFASNYLMM